jgi:murein DD-endopeptidase MepM/ murein hydrolase activator NlpD
MQPRTQHRTRSSFLVLAAVAGLSLIASGCGQIGGTHGGAGGAISPVSFSSPGVGMSLDFTGEPDAGPSGTVTGPTISGDNATLQRGQGVTRVVTVTQILPQAPQFQLPVRVNDSSGSGSATGGGNPNDPLKACPVQARFSVSDDFGAPRYTTTPPHPHAGNDIMAPEYSPIVAPFDGVAQASPSPLGGNGVIVRGADGYVYNAHLVAYGKLGAVKTGDVVGYVGNTGDARGGAYHDHFEWHPYHPTINWVSPYGYSVVDDGNPPAVDPFPYLEQACPHS